MEKLLYSGSVYNKKMGIRELAERAKAEGAYDLAQGVLEALGFDIVYYKV